MNFTRILKAARDKKVALETFSSDGPSEFLVVSRMRWDEHQRRLNAQREELRMQPTCQQNSSSSSSGRQWQAGLEGQRVAWSSSERNVTAAVKITWRDVPIASGHGGFGALDGARRSRGLSKVLNEVLDEGEAAIFSSSSEKVPFRGKQ